MTAIRILIVSLLAVFAAQSAIAAEKVALVIGNGKYSGQAPLDNPANDAKDIGKVLEDIGFDVTVATDQTFSQAQQILSNFSDKASGANIALIYYAGHGMQIDGVNHLIPTDFKFKKEEKTATGTIVLEALVAVASNSRDLAVVVVDAARTNPYATEKDIKEAIKHADSITPDEIKSKRRTKAIVVGYSTGSGKNSLDGKGQSNSPYAQAVMDGLKIPDIDIDELFRKVSGSVFLATDGFQRPVHYSMGVEKGTSLSASEKAVRGTEENRIALVIGNNDYAAPWPDLDNPVHDANDMAAALEDMGFRVTLATDATRARMEDLVQNFARAAREADTALVFYAGHGVQHNGTNYLVPVDGKLEDETDLRRYVRVSDILRDLQRAKGAKILILDACRDSEKLLAYLDSLPKSRSFNATRGLAKEKAEGVLIAFAAQPNAVAADALEGTDNSPFTDALLRHIKTPGIELRTLLTRVRADVYRSTEQAQLPETSDSMIGEFRFVSR